MVARIVADRPRLLAAAMASRDHELGRDDLRADLIEFASFVLLAELSGQRIGAQASRQPFTLALVGFGQKYHDPRILRDLAHLVKAGMPW